MMIDAIYRRIARDYGIRVDLPHDEMVQELRKFAMKNKWNWRPK
jgi:hypothetical protein